MTPSQYLLETSHKLETPVISKEVSSHWRHGHPNFKPFSVGDLVLKKTHQVGNRVTNKFASRFHGPYKITKVQSNGVSYEIQEQSDTNGLIYKVHHTQVKKFISLPRYISRNKHFMELLRKYSGFPINSRSSGDSDSESGCEVDRERSCVAVSDSESDPCRPCFSGVEERPGCLLYTSPSPRDKRQSRMPSSA